MLKSPNYKIITKTFKEATIVFLLFALVFSFPLSVLAEEVAVGESPVVEESLPAKDVSVGEEVVVGNDGAPVVSDTTEKTEDLVPTEGLRSMSMMSSASSNSSSEGVSLENQKPAQSKIKVEADEATGALNYSIPIFSPAGRNGLSPDLKLNYNSQDQNNFNLFGYGWSINIPSIERINKKGIEKLYTENYFNSSLSGELRSINLVDATHGKYGARVESGDFLNYQFNADNSWSVADKTGLVYKFGLTADSRQDDPNNSAKIFKWMLTEIRDQNNNYIKYEYYKEAGQIYPARIIYSGNGLNDGVYEVGFGRETRADNLVSFASGFRIENKYRIKEVAVKFNGDWVRKYGFDYITGDNGYRSLLKSFAESAKDSAGNISSLNKKEFGYQKINKGWTENSNWIFPTIFVNNADDKPDTGVRLADANGDGLLDVLMAVTEASGRQYNKIFLNDGRGWELSNSWQNAYDFVNKVGIFDDMGVRLEDLQGDGLIDVVHAMGGLYNARDIYFNNGSSWAKDLSWIFPSIFINNQSDKQDVGTRMADVNADGLPDLLESATLTYGPHINRVSFNNGSGWALNSSWQLPADIVNHSGELSDMGVRFADVNGDGLSDVIQALGGGPNKVYVNTGNGWVEDANWIFPTIFINLNTEKKDVGTRLADVNNDGLVDVLQAANLSTGQINRVYLNTGNGWVYNSDWQVPYDFVNHSGILSDMGSRLADVNGDGSVDFIQAMGGFYNSNRTFLNNNNGQELLEEITEESGSAVKVLYKTSAMYQNEEGGLANPTIRSIINTVNQITTNDGSGNLSTSTYEYSGGEYYFKDSFDRRFAGFAKVKKTDDYGNTAISYYHQGNTNDTTTQEQNDHSSKIGRVYRTEIYDGRDVAVSRLYAVTINKWENTDLGNDRNFVKLTQTVEQDFDGQSTHRDKAESYVYDDANGNLTAKTSWGEVNATTDGTFTDVGDDKLIANYSYAINSAKNILGLPSRETVSDSSKQIADSRYYYDGLALGQVDKGNPTKEEKWINNNDYASYQKEYNSYGLVTKEIDPNGNATQYIYDQYNLYPITIKNALNQTTQLEYDYATGQAKKSIDPNGNIIQKEFDGFGRTKTIKQSDPENANTLNLINSYEYNDTSYPRSVKETKYLNASLSVDSITYLDGFDRAIQIRTRTEGDNQYSVKDTIYNKTGQVEKESLPYFSSGINNTISTTDTKLFVSYEYDALNRPTKITNVLGVTTNQYQNWQTTTTDPLNNQKTLEMDARGNLVKVLEFNGSETYTTKYDYNAQNKLIKITDALNNERNFGYDYLGRLNFQDDLHNPTDTTYGMYYFEYDKAGNLIGKADMNGNSVSYTYDVLNRMKTEDNAGTQGIEVSYGYDSCLNGAGRLCLVAQINTNLAQINTNYEYYVGGQMKNEKRIMNNVEYATHYFYDWQGGQFKIIYPDNTEVRYEYTTGGQVEKVYKKETTDANEIIVVENIDRNPLGQTTLQKLANGIETNYTFDANELYRLKNKITLRPRSLQQDSGQAGQASLKLQNLNYTYDPVGNISQIIDSSETNLAKTSVFSYDNLYRLTSATTTSAVMGDNFVQTYQYNAIGNILNKSHSAGSGQADIGNYEYKGNTEAKNYANPHAVTKVAPSAGSGLAKIYTYDKNGNLASNGEWTHSWDYNNRLISSTKASSTVSYAYDPTGNRVYKKEGSKESYYINKYYDINDGNVSRYIYLGDQKIATISGQDQNTGCVPPKTGDWNITASCTMPTSAKASGSVIINSGAVLTINASTTLEIDLRVNKLMVKKGGGVLVKKGGTLRQAQGEQFNNVTIKQLVYHLTDHLTGTNIDTDEQGNILEAIDYYPFGGVRLDEKNGNYENKYKYTGKELDADTGLYYYGARYYDSGAGRFVSIDPLYLSLGMDDDSFKKEYGKNKVEILADPQGLNSYSYVKNNPLRYVDPTGEDYLEISFSGTFFILSGSVGVQFNSSGINISVSAGPAIGVGLSVEGKSSSNNLSSQTQLTKSTNLEAAYGVGLSSSKQYSNSSNNPFDKSTSVAQEFGVVVGVGASASAKCDVSIPVVKSKTQNSTRLSQQKISSPSSAAKKSTTGPNNQQKTKTNSSSATKSQTANSTPATVDVNTNKKVETISNY